MNTLTRLSRHAAELREILDDEGGLELELTKRRVKTLRRIADQIDAVVVEQRDDLVAERQAAKEREDAERAARIAEVKALAEKYNLKVSVSQVATEREKRASSKQIREWAEANGLTVQPTGMIPRVVKDAYRRAHPISTFAEAGQ